MGTGSEYERYEEPYSHEVRDRRVRGARGLQAVDGLTTSAAFDEAAERYVAGDISARELSDIVDDYYDQKVERGVNRYSQEADLVSARICDALDSNGFTFSPATLRAIHGRLFRGLMEEPFYEQHYRDYNISKREFVLARESVAYGDYASLEDDLETAFSEFSPAPAQDGDYTAYIASVADFIARVWQIHPFAEGNTRTVAVFLQQLLHFHGFPQDCSEAFDRSSLQFRNALVRANYRNIPLGVEPDPTFLNEFIGCLIAGRPFPYRNRDMAAAELFRSKGLIPPQEESPRRLGKKTNAVPRLGAGERRIQVAPEASEVVDADGQIRATNCSCQSLGTTFWPKIDCKLRQRLASPRRATTRNPLIRGNTEQTQPTFAKGNAVAKKGARNAS